METDVEAKRTIDTRATSLKLRGSSYGLLRHNEQSIEIVSYDFGDSM